MKTILIVDDEPDIREIVSFNLTQAGYICLCAANGKDARSMLNSSRIDLMLLDVMMAGQSGYGVARAIRNDEWQGVPYDLPIIFLTALGDESDMLQGFSLGADDYISKPFSLRLLLARVEAVMKRTSQVEDNVSDNDINENGNENVLRYETLCLQDDTYLATIAGEDIGLTKMEYELLHHLLVHKGVVYSRNELLQQVWPGNGLVLDRTVDVTITRIRKKIGEYKDYLKTKTGYGYYWEK